MKHDSPSCFLGDLYFHPRNDLAKESRPGTLARLMRSAGKSAQPANDEQSKSFLLCGVTDIVAVVVLVEESADFFAQASQVLLLEGRIRNFG